MDRLLVNKTNRQLDARFFPFFFEFEAGSDLGSGKSSRRKRKKDSRLLSIYRLRPRTNGEIEEAKKPVHAYQLKSLSERKQSTPDFH